VRKTSSRPVTTLTEGQGVLKEVQLHCPEHKGTVYRAKTARIITPARSPYGWDLWTDAGLQRFGEHRQIAEIRRYFLERTGTAIPERTISHMCSHFAEHWIAVHIESVEALRDVLEAQGGCVLHLDATGENGSRPLFAVKESLSGMTLWACRVPSENRRDLATVLGFVKRSFGKVLAAVRDMGEGVARAAKEVLEGAYILVCHFHFLRAVGNRLLEKPYVSFQKRLNRTGVKGALRKLLAALKKKKDKDSSELHIEELVRHILAYEKAGEGLGAPFDLLDLVFYERCVEAEPRLRELILGSAKENRHDAWACRAEDALRRLHPTPALRGQLERAYERLKGRQRWFDGARRALRYRNGPVPLSTLVAFNERELERAEKEVSRFLERLGRAVEGTMDGVPDKGLKQTLRGIRELFIKNRAHLLAPNVVIGTGTEARVVKLPRTNNPLEKEFRVMRSHYRRIQGNARIEAKMQSEGVGMALLLNLDNPRYMKAVYGRRDRIAERFCQLRPESLVLARQLIRGEILIPNGSLPQ
jgi:hypothetical protein